MENSFYHERNQNYIEASILKLKETALQKDFFGSAHLEFKIQNGIVQLVSYTIETRVIAKKENQKHTTKDNLIEKGILKTNTTIPNTAMAQAFQKARIVKEVNNGK